MQSPPASDANQPGRLDGRAALLMTMLCLIWSLQQISLKAVAGQASPMLMVALRSGAAMLLLLPVMRRRAELPRAARWKAGIGAGSLFALEYFFIAEALRRTSAGHVVIFLYTAPIFAAIGLHLRLPAERLRPLQMAGIGSAFVGIAIAFLGRSPDAAALAENGQRWIGDLLALGGALAWAATTLTIRGSSLASAPATETTFYQLLCAFVLLLPVSWASGNWHFEASAEVWAHLGFQTFVMSFASLLTWCWLLRHYLASRLGAFSFLTPLFGVLLGAALLGETLAPQFVLGGFLVLVGLALVSGQELLAGTARRAHPHNGRDESPDEPGSPSLDRPQIVAPVRRRGRSWQH